MHNRKPLLIDFTPLLDVILIILFLVLVNSGVKAEQTIREAENKHQAEQELIEAQLSEQEFQIIEQKSELANLRQELFEAEGQKTKLEQELQQNDNYAELDKDQKLAFSAFLENSTTYRLKAPHNYPQAKMELQIGKTKDQSLVMPDDQKLEEWLTTQIKENPSEVNIIIFEYYSQEILWRDYYSIKETLIRLQDSIPGTLYSEEKLFNNN